MKVKIFTVIANFLMVISRSGDKSMSLFGWYEPKK